METKKTQKLNINDFVKDGSSTITRLQSLRLPRDLSLGGSKTKKVFKPNVNVIRKKNKIDTGKKTDKPKSQTERKPPEKVPQRYVQSKSVFSEGFGSSKIFKSSNVSVVEEKSERSKNISTPALSKNIEFDKDYEEHILESLKNESKTENKRNLPFEPEEWSMSEDVKKEKELTSSDLTQLPTEYNRKELCSRSALTLWQLPDSFAFEKSKNNKMLDVHLNDMPAGKIGKICVRKSGKMEIHIGNVQYELEKPNFEMFREEVVSLNENNKSCLVVGQVQNRFILNPNWESLLT